MNRLNPIEFARQQRRIANSHEDLLWQILRNRQRWGIKFRRQQPLGPFTADFFCPDARLNIEIDGEHHFTEEGKKYDAARDRWMLEQGIHVLRFTGNQIEFETQSVSDEIESFLRTQGLLSAPPLTPNPSPARGEGSENGTKTNRE